MFGDFNDVLSRADKKGGLQVKNYETSDFVDCIGTLDLVDLKSLGCYFTWMSPKVCSKLDRVMVSHDWFGTNFVSIAEFVAPGCISDHTISIVSCFEDRFAKVKRAFKFFNMWTLSDKLLVIVAQKWCFDGYGTAQFRVKQLVNRLKGPLKNLNVKHFIKMFNVSNC